MGEYVERWPPGMKAQVAKSQPPIPESALLIDEEGRRYYEQASVCRDCGREYTYRVYVFKNDWRFDTKHLGCCPTCYQKRVDEYNRQEKANAEAALNLNAKNGGRPAGYP